MTKTLTQTETQQTWDLKDLYGSLTDPAIARDSEQLKADIALFATDYASDDAWQTTSSTLVKALQRYTQLVEKLHNLGTYVNLEWSVATQDAEVNQLRDRIQRELAQAGADLEFFRQALSHFAPERIQALTEDSALAPYAHFLTKVSAFQPFLLSTPEERMLQLTQPYSRQRWLDFYTQTTSTWTFSAGSQVDLTEDQVADLMRQPDPALRLEAYQSLYGKYQEHVGFTSYIYNTLLQEYAQEARLRNFGDTLSQQVFEQELRPEQVKQLLSEVEQRFDLYQRYYRALAKGLGIEKVRACDLSAPLSQPMVNASTQWDLSWEASQKTLLDALEPLGTALTAKTRAFFEHRWIHAQPAKGKSSGAFCAPTAHTHPYILMNWNDSLNALTTLAHELGHGLHFYETAASENILHMMPPLFLAETASTFNEYLLAVHLLEQHPDPKTQRYLISDLLQRFMNGTYRQSQITAFEVFAHEEGARQQLSAERLNAHWLALAKARAGDAIEILPEEASGWSRIPHLFMYPFYCYNYTLSGLIVLALVHQYQHQREAFLPRYQRFLKAGGSRSAQDLLRLLELDLEDPGFYTSAFAVLEDWVTQLEQLNLQAGMQT